MARTVALLVGGTAVAAIVAVVGVLIGWWAAMDRRPEILTDARRGDPASAQAFNRTFQAGTGEGELTGWLGANDFEVDPEARNAYRLVMGFPCNEAINVAWTTDERGQLASASATVREAGCV